MSAQSSTRSDGRPSGQRADQTADQVAVPAAGGGVGAPTGENLAATRTIELDVSGMTCASCVGRVERKLGKLEGVSATVNLPLERASVTAPESVSDDELIYTVDRAGYTARLRDGRDPASGEPDPHVSRARRPARAADLAGGEELGPRTTTLTPRLIGAALLSLPLFVISMVPALQFPHWGWMALVLATPVVFWAGWPFHAAAFRAARHGSTTMDTLVSLGVLAAWMFSTVELVLDPGMTAQAGTHAAPWWDLTAMADHQLYYETAGVITTFLLLGRWLEARAQRRAGEALRSLLELGATTAAVVRDGREQTIPAAELVPGDEFVVRPGEKIATDGFVVSGQTAVDTSLITGESMPEEVGEGDTVTGATINTSGRLLVRATRTGQDTVLAQMGRLVSDAQSGKAPIARLADRISSVFVPIVLVIAVVTFAAWMIISGDGHAAFRASVAVLVIACPCALGLATPVGLLAGTGRASQLGILIRGPQVLEDTRTVDTIVLDKTGTVTEGSMAVTGVRAFGDFGGSGGSGGHDQATVLDLAAAVESGSEHPIARAILAAAQDSNQHGHDDGREGTLPEVTDFRSSPGGGITGAVAAGRATRAVAVGRTSHIVDHLDAGVLTAGQERAHEQAESTGATAVWVAVDGDLAGLISVQDTVRDSSVPAIAQLRELGLRPVLLTGDNRRVADQVAAAVGIHADDVIAGVRPEQKVATVAELQQTGRVVAMVGDGVNDAPALAQADLGIAMGAGTDVAREAADITVMGSSLEQVVQSVQLSRRTLSTIKTNLFWAFLYNTLGIPVAALGLLNPMVAGAAMALSSVLVVANSLRLTRFAR